MPRKSEVIITTDAQSPTGYALIWGEYRENFGTPESIELFKPVRSFRFISIHGDYVARQEHRAGRAYWYGYLQNNFVNIVNEVEEHRAGRAYWYGYKRFGARVHKVYLGKHHRLTLHGLEEAAVQLYVTQMTARI